MADAVRALIVYASDTGTTQAMAEAVADGARAVAGATVEVVRLHDGTEVPHDQARAADALLVGTPVRHRSMHHAVKRFVEDVLEALWLTDDLVGRVGGVFSVGGGHGDAGAGADLCQVGVLAALAASGLVLVPLPKSTPGADHAGSHWGPHGRTGGPKMEPLALSDDMLAAGRHHGAAVVRVAAALRPHRDGLFDRGNTSPSPETLEAFASGDPSRQPPPDGFVSGPPIRP